MISLPIKMPVRGPSRRGPLPIAGHHFGWLTDIVSAAAAREPERLYTWLSASRSELHFAALTLALLPNEEARMAVEPQLFTVPKKTVFAAALPRQPRVLIALSRKLAGEMWRPKTYRKLADLVRDPTAEKLLVKARSVERRRVLALAQVPAPLRVPAVYERLRKTSDARQLVFAVELVERIRPDLRREEVLASLVQASPKVALDMWVRAHFKQASFPPPPWPGTARLKPLQSWNALEKEALAFRNCIRSYAQDVLSGSTYLYRYEDEDGLKAIVSISRIAHDQWIVDEIKGPDNKTLSPTEHAVVVEELAGGALMPPQGLHLWSWTNPDY